MSEQRGAHSVEKMAKVLRVTRSGFYAWLNREPGPRAKEQRDLVEQIQRIQHEVGRRTGDRERLLPNWRCPT